MKPISLSLTGSQHDHLKALLYPGDDREAAALVLCGRSVGWEGERLLGYEVIPVPEDAYETRETDLLTWKTGFLAPYLDVASKKGFALLKLHSHPSGYSDFSATDDRADAALFPSVCGWVDDGRPHASAIMVPDGRIFGRAHHEDGRTTILDQVIVVDDDITIWRSGPDAKISAAGVRNAQAFGETTYSLLRGLRIAVVGCSGTGSVVVETLARLEVGELLLVDDDCVEEKNLNRIIGTTMADVGRLKSDVLSEHVNRIGLGTRTRSFPTQLAELDTLRAVASADLVIGCMDSVDGRHTLNRLATFYLLPYFDIGVRLIADGAGGIEQICGSVHYLQPGRSSLSTRGLYTLDAVRAAHLRRANPEAYAAELEEKYISGVDEGRPAVAPVNLLFSARATMEILARIHPYRLESNSEFATTTESLSAGFIRSLPEGETDKSLRRYVGRGDMTPFLDSPILGG